MRLPSPAACALLAAAVLLAACDRDPAPVAGPAPAATPTPVAAPTPPPPPPSSSPATAPPAAASPPPATPKDPRAMLKIGDPAPAFTVLDHTGKARTLAEFQGQRVVLWFFPKALTGG